jgi:hypothetical protein
MHFVFVHGWGFNPAIWHDELSTGIRGSAISILASSMAAYGNDRMA